MVWINPLPPESEPHPAILVKAACWAAGAVIFPGRSRDRVPCRDGRGWRGSWARELSSRLGDVKGIDQAEALDLPGLAASTAATLLDHPITLVG